MEITILVLAVRLAEQRHAAGLANVVNAVNAANATTATNATQLGGAAAGQYVLTTDLRITDTRIPTAGSRNHFQNVTSQLVASDLDISAKAIAEELLAGASLTTCRNSI